MSIFQTDGPASARASSRNHCSKPVRAMRAWNSSVRGSASSTSFLRTGEFEPGLQVGLAVEAQDGDVVLLDAGHGRLEAIALQAGRLRLRGGDLALPGAVLGLLAGLHPGADHGRDRRGLAAAFVVAHDVDVVAADQHRRRALDARLRARSRPASASHPRWRAKRCRITQSTCSGGLGGISRCSMKPGKLAIDVLVSPCQRAKSSALLRPHAGLRDDADAVIALRS